MPSRPMPASGSGAVARTADWPAFVFWPTLPTWLALPDVEATCFAEHATASTAAAMSELDSYVVSIRFNPPVCWQGSLEILSPPFAILFQGAQQIGVMGWFALFIDVVVEVEK